MTFLYPNPCYNEVCYKVTALYQSLGGQNIDTCNCCKLIVCCNLDRHFKGCYLQKTAKNKDIVF